MYRLQLKKSFYDIYRTHPKDVCLFAPGGGGTPVLGAFPGHWFQVFSWGYPSPRFFPRSFLGGPRFFWGGGTPVLAQPGQDGVPPNPGTEQLSEYLLCCGRYASWGLSCSFCFYSFALIYKRYIYTKSLHLQ